LAQDIHGARAWIHRAMAEETAEKAEEAALDKTCEDADEQEDQSAAPPSQGGRPVAAPSKANVFTTGKSIMQQAAGRESYADLLDEEQEDAVEEDPVLPPMLDEGWQQLEGTPCKNAAYHQRFLAWNDHGHCAFDPREHKFEIWYASDEKPRHLVDKSGFDMMAMSSTAACMASSATASSEIRSRIRIHPRRRWEKQSFEASIVPEGGEKVEAVACGEDFVAALTSGRLLRVYTLSGLPMCLFSVPGRSIALAARGHVLVVVTGQGTPAIDGEEERLEFRFMDVSKPQELASGRLPLSSASQLRWLSITAELAPITIDTAGVVRALLGLGAGAWGCAASHGGEWVPVLSLAADEARNGPLWAVSAQQGVLFCAQPGADMEEPLPNMLEEPEEAPERKKPRFGRGADLLEKSWSVPCAPISAVSSPLGELFADHLVALHASSMNRLGHTTQSDQGNDSTSWKSRFLLAFEELVQADELELALDVTKSVLSRGGSGTLNSAMDFAERKRHRRLADEIKMLLRVAEQSTSLSQTVPKAVKQELPPLFTPFEDSVPQLLLASAPRPEPDATADTVKNELPSPPKQAREPALGNHMEQAAGDGTMEAAVPAAAPKVNPFARTKRAQTAAQAPHFLRDALGAPTSERTAKSARRSTEL